MWYGLEFAPCILTCDAISVRGDGKASFDIRGAASYCTSLLLPLGSTARDVTINTCCPFLKLTGLVAKFPGPMYWLVPSKKTGVTASISPSPLTSVLADCSVFAVMRTHLNSGPGSPPASTNVEFCNPTTTGTGGSGRGHSCWYSVSL